MKASVPKPVVWMGDSLARLQTFPPSVQDEIGYALYLAQIGGKHVSAKPLMRRFALTELAGPFFPGPAPIHR